MFRIGLSLLVLFSTNAFAVEEAVGRYTLSSTRATAEQRFPLIQIKTLAIPRAIQTNAEAVSFVLRDTGYRVATDRVRTEEDRLLMDKALAEICRSYTNTTLLEMLDAIAGLGFTPVVDPINRLIAFEALYDFME